MKDITINEITYQIATDWSEITIDQFILARKLSSQYQGLELRRQILIQLFKIDPEFVDDENSQVIFLLISHIHFLFEDLPEYADNASLGFTFDSVDYILKDISKTKFETWIDYEAFLKKYNWKKDNDHSEYLPYIIALLVERVDGQQEDILELAEKFKLLPMSITFGLASFFLNSMLERSILIQSYLAAQKTIQAKVELLDNSLSTMVGGTWFTRFVQKMLLKWIRYYKPQLLQSLIYLPIKSENQK